MIFRTMSAVIGVTIYLSVFCNIIVMTSEITPAQDHFKTANTEDFHANMTTDSEKSTFSSGLDIIDSTNNNTSTTSGNTLEVAPSLTSTPAAATQSIVSVSGPSTVSAAAASTLLLSSIVPSTGSPITVEIETHTKITSTEKNTITLFSTQEDLTLQTNATETTLNSTTSATLMSVTETDKQSLKYSEIVLTSIFSTILVTVVLVILAYSFKKCFRQRSQYSHRPLRETSFDSADQYSPPDDTLVISGGLYDAPRIYNPNMTVLEEEESQNDIVSFSSTRPGQFRLEFLPGDKDLDPSFKCSSQRNV